MRIEKLTFSKSVLLIVLFTFLSGAIRKWIITTEVTNNIILAIQLIIPYLFLFSSKDNKMPTRYSILNIYFLYLLFSVFNPLNLTVMHGILGLILHLGFWFLMAFYFANRENADLKLIVNIIIVLGIVEIILAFIQYELPPDNFLNKYANSKYVGGDETYALVGDAVRVTGTFSYLGGFMAFVIFWALFIWALLRFKYNLMIVLLLALSGLLIAFMSGSRNATAIYLVTVVMGVLYEFSVKKIFDTLSSFFLPGLILTAIFILSSGKLNIEKRVGNVFDNFNSRVQENKAVGEQNQRVYSNLNEVVSFRGNYPFFGVGLGSTYQGATALFGTSDYVKEYGYYEDEWGRIVLEGGFVLLAFRFCLFAWMFHNLRIPIVAKIILFISFFYFTQMVFNVYNSIFIFLGLIFLDKSFDYKIEKELDENV